MLIVYFDILDFRKHFLQCPQGLLSKHLEKLIQYDPRLYALSQEPEIQESRFFEPRCYPFDNLKDSYGSSVQEFQDSASACAGRSTSANGGTSVDVSVAEIHPPSSGSFGTQFCVRTYLCFKGSGKQKYSALSTMKGLHCFLPMRS